MTGLFEREEQRHGGDRRSQLERVKERVSASLLVFSLVSLVFTGGYNWRRVDEQAKSIEALEQANRKIDDTYVKREVLTAQFETITAQLNALKQQLDDVKQALRDTHR